MNTNQKRVLKDYPDAQIVYYDGSVRVMSGDLYIAEEYFFPDTDSPEVAWDYAALACKTTQHFNRTHPNRMTLLDIESKLARIRQRKQKAVKRFN
jgi:hypothetical protein